MQPGEVSTAQNVRAEDTAAAETVGPLTQGREHDTESAQWIRTLRDAGPVREEALARLHELLLRVAHRELHRRSGQHPITGPELDDLAHHAAADALLAITGKLDEFRGESRFTTWAYKFVVFEVSTKLGRHFWLKPTVALDAEGWERLPDRFGTDPADHAQGRALVDAVHRAVDEHLTQRQRQVFVAIVLQGVPLDALVVRLSSSRNAIYKTLFDARRKLRVALAANGYLSAAGNPAAAVSAEMAEGRQS
jgi:RNA polymerase sigma-70 factor (ECF subfamily)